MKSKSTKTTREPSKASLREIPEVALSRAVILGRGRHVAKARRSFESLTVDKKVLKVLGGHDAVLEILRVLANSVAAAQKKHRAA
jgi:hypothetical protein